MTGNPHLIGGEFQSDKYPTTPRGKVPLSTRDKAAQDLLWRALEAALKANDFTPPPAADVLAESIDQVVLDLSGPGAGASEREQRLRVLLVLAAARIRGMLDALQRALPVLESIEAKSLVGDEGCLWPVEVVRAEIDRAACSAADIDGTICGAPLTPADTKTAGAGGKRSETILAPGPALWSEPTR
jgi:hypothetical protein